MQLQKAVLDSLFLCNQSPDHRLYTLVEFNHYCVFPILHSKARLFYDKGKPIGFVSWAWVTKQEATDFLSETWIPNEEVWQRPPMQNDQHLWGIDFIAPYGHSVKVMRGMIQHSHKIHGRGVPVNWRRINKQPDKIHMKEF